MHAGLLDQRITLQQRSESLTPRGGQAYTWSDYASVWARAEPLSGREFFAAAQAQAQATVRFRLRWRDDLDSTMRVEWRDRTFEIVAPPADIGGAREVLELMCAETT